MKTYSDFKLPAFLWLVFPCLIMICQIMVEILVPNQYLGALHSEGGPHEAIEALFVVIAFFIAVKLFLQVKQPWLRAWAGLAAICCFYVAGEELSWGQHVFGWGTPEFWSQVNDQNETNLHNTSSWLDQKPRAILEIGVAVGGLIIPALQKWKPSALPEKYKDIYPVWPLAVTAGFGVIVKLCGFIHKELGIHIFYRSSEVLELYLFYFVLLYLLGLTRKWRSEGKI